MDELLARLCKVGGGCHMSCWFIAAHVGLYADDFVLLAPSATAMRCLCVVCDSFASEYSVMFNANKSKCLIFRPINYRPGVKSALISGQQYWECWQVASFRSHY